MLGLTLYLQAADVVAVAHRRIGCHRRRRPRTSPDQPCQLEAIAQGRLSKLKERTSGRNAVTEPEYERASHTACNDEELEDE